MLLHRAPHPTEELRSSGTHPVEDLHELPEFPEGVVIPDDLRGLEPPTTPSGVRWLRWAAVVALAVVAAAIVLLVRGGGETERTEPSIVMSPAAEIVQDEIDTAIAELRVDQQVRDYYENLYVSTYPTPAYQIVQNEIDAAIAERTVAEQIRSHYVDLYADYLAVQPLPAYQIIQNEIEHALNEQAVLNDILEYYADLAARTG